MSTWTKFNSFTEALAEKVHNLGSDTLKIALTNTAPVASNTVLTDITQITSAGGYAPATVTVTTSAQSGGTYTLAASATTWTASGADFDAFRYLVLYNDTAASDELIAYLDYSVSYVLPDGLPFTLSAGTVLTLA